MAPHQERMVAEHKDLHERRERLSVFIGGPIYYSLAAAEQDRLLRQHRAMQEYENVLMERIAVFSLPAAVESV